MATLDIPSGIRRVGMAAEDLVEELRHSALLPIVAILVVDAATKNKDEAHNSRQLPAFAPGTALLWNFVITVDKAANHRFAHRESPVSAARLF
jgi:hypothetical protein